MIRLQEALCQVMPGSHQQGENLFVELLSEISLPLSTLQE
jgi:hypothetical protein